MQFFLLSNISRAATNLNDYLKLDLAFPFIFYPFSAISNLINLYTAWQIKKLL